MNTIIGARPEVRRIEQTITLEQDGLLDQCSHIDAPRLLGELNQIITLLHDSGLSNGCGIQMSGLESLVDCLEEITQESTTIP